ncbi:hypothetical protein GDO81_025361 [Engystomops pustulosus]|nr:hypothetical protein GDO81_025361 [Engystomops pustulosus]KAG8548443.1 hypothetical protein GDO81_025361 [Engystomops pustulosus]
MENHRNRKPLTSPKRPSKRIPSKNRKSEENVLRSSRNRQRMGAKIPPNSEDVPCAEPDGSGKRNAPESCPSPPYFQGDHSILQDNQVEHFGDFEIIVKEEEKEEKELLMIIEEDDVPKHIIPVARRRNRNRKQAVSLPICFIDHQTAKMPRLKRMELKVKELISAVQGHPELWDPSNRGYSDRQKKADAWSSVCRYLYPEWDDLDNRDKDILDNDVRRRWRSARDQFRREIVQRECQNGLAPPSKKPYIHLEELMFLVPVLDLRPAIINGTEAADLPGAQDYHFGDSEPEVQAVTQVVGALDPSEGGRSFCPEEPSTTSTASSVSQVLPLPHPRGRKDKKANYGSASADTIDSQVLAYLQRNIEEDSEDAFVRSLASYMQKVPEQWRLCLRSSIQTLIEACIPPNDPEKVLDILDEVKLSRPPMDIELITPMASYQSPSQPHYGLSSSSHSSPNSYPQSPPCPSHSFPRLPSYSSQPSTSYPQDSLTQPNYAFHSHRESKSHASYPSSVSCNSHLSSSNVPPTSSRASDPMSTSPSCLNTYGSMSTSPPLHSSYTISRPQSQ